MIFSRASLRIVVAACLAMAGHAVALAQDAQGAAPPASLDALTGTGATARSASVDGFRSARFGMDDAAVREAITSDFGIDAAAITESENPAERTQILTARVPDVLQDGGAADVSYVMGYESGTLAQVSVLWSPETDPAVDSDRLVANANVLQNYFLSAGYEAATTVVNIPVAEGLVMFRGTDAEGRMAVLLLRGTLATEAPAEGAAEGSAGQPVLTPTSLLLAYLADPEDPDVFTVEPGQF